MNIEIFKMTLLDLNSISNILISDFDDFWTFNILKKELESENSKYIVAKSDNEIIGFAGIKVMADECDIMNIVVKKDYRNKGVGLILLKHLINISEKLNMNCINLEVNENNLPAIHLYEKVGFKKIGIRKNYYKQENALIMKK